MRDEEEEIVEGQKEDDKLGFCEIQWQQQSHIDGRKFNKKNNKRLEEPPPLAKLDLSITKIVEENDEDRVQIIPLTSPMRVRSPLNYRSPYNIDSENPNNLNVLSRETPVDLSVANIKTISNPFPPSEPSTSSSLHDVSKRSSLLSLKSLSTSLRLLKNRGKSLTESVENFDSVATLETIDETDRRKSIFRMDMIERNLKKFVSKSNEADFQTYSDYQQSQSSQVKPKPRTFFKNQKVHDRRSSMSDINDPNQIQNSKLSHNQSSVSTSSTNVKHEPKKKEKAEKDKVAEVLKEVRKRNMESAKRFSAPRRISTAY